MPAVMLSDELYAACSRKAAARSRTLEDAVVAVLREWSEAPEQNGAQTRQPEADLPREEVLQYIELPRPKPDGTVIATLATTPRLPSPIFVEEVVPPRVRVPRFGEPILVEVIPGGERLPPPLINEGDT